jgi:putative membrane protein
MYTGHHYPLVLTLRWSSRGIWAPALYSVGVVCLYELLGLTFLTIPTLPMSLIGIAVAFYLGFKNNASYGRLWEARTLWGGIVNSSRSWAHSVRDLVGAQAGDGSEADPDLRAVRQEMVLRHIAWMDALRHQLRRLQPWEHTDSRFERLRVAERVPERVETMDEALRRTLSESEAARATAQLNPAAFLLAEQSRHLAELRRQGLLDGFAHTLLMEILQQLMNFQGGCERIKNFPFPRQYATVNSLFARLFALLVPFGLLPEFVKMGPGMVWLTIPFASIVSWVFLTTDQIGEWSENPFEGLANDVPISTISRAIERDMRQMLDISELPPPVPPSGKVQY